MKLQLFFFLAIFLFFGDSSAQENMRADVGTSCFNKGKVFINGGYGLVNANFIIAKQLEKSLLNGWDEVSFSKVPNFFAKGEYAVSNRVGVGVNLATGGLIAHVVLQDSLNNQIIRISGDLTYRSWSALARVNYHALNAKNWDIYVGLGIGYRLNTFSVTSDDPFADRWNFPIDLGLVERTISNSVSYSYVGADLTLGVAYQITPAIGVYTEMGMAKSAIQAGLRIGFNAAESVRQKPDNQNY